MRQRVFKQCVDCLEYKHIEDEFYTHPKMKDGYVNNCISCYKQKVKDRWFANHESNKEKERARHKTEKGKLKLRKCTIAFRAKNPEKYKAHTAVSNALRDKRLFKSPCIKCGDDRSQAHHEDYSKPLEVIWLCKACHNAEHFVGFSHLPDIPLTRVNQANPRRNPGVLSFLRHNKRMARKPVVFNNLIKSDCINVGKFVGKESVQMVYIDPPYLTGKDFYKSDGAFAYSDKFSDISAYISFMSQRIYRIRECLKPAGSIWVHIDRRVLYNLKLEMDDIFGEDNFLGDIIWNGGNGMRGTGKFPHTHQTILVYAKDKSKVTLNLPREPISDMAATVYYKYEDEKGRYCLRDSNGKQYKYYLDSGKRMGSVWNDIPASLGGGVMKKLENTDYPTQKPLALLDRLINFASDKGDLVMDCFCGSGTTGHSAYNNGRVYTLFDVGSLAIETCKARLSHTPFTFSEA